MSNSIKLLSMKKDSRKKSIVYNIEILVFRGYNVSVTDNVSDRFTFDNKKAVHSGVTSSLDYTPDFSWKVLKFALVRTQMCDIMTGQQKHYSLLPMIRRGPEVQREDI